MPKNSRHAMGDKPKIDRAEWDFSQCPKNERMQCCAYEYARSSPEIREAYREAQKRALPENLPQLYMPLSTQYGLCLDCPEFPERPWLKIERKVRGKRVKRVVSFTQPAFVVGAHPMQRPGFNAESGDEVFGAFQIAWACPQEKILEDFARWLEANHAQRQAAITDRTAIWPSRFGSTAPKMLKALAAWRLLRVMSWEEAALFTSSPEDQNAKGLFEYQSGWSRAKSQAQQHLFGVSADDLDISA